MDNVQKHNNYINIPQSQTLDLKHGLNSVTCSAQANYTDRAAAACQRS
jgi:hypothetical protein